MSYRCPSVELEVLEAAKERGNQLYRSLSSRPMSEQTKCQTLNEAIVAYQEGLKAITLKAPGNINMNKNNNKSSAQVDKYLEVERALYYNLGVTYWHLGQIERRKVTKFHCYVQFAQAFSHACKLQELQLQRNPAFTEDKISRSLEKYLASVTSFIETESSNEAERIQMLAAFVLELNVRIKDRSRLEVYQRCLASLWLDLGKQQFYLAYEDIAKKSFQEGLSFMMEVSRSVEEAALYDGDEEHNSEIRVLRQDHQSNLSIAESLQSLHIGKQMLEKALKDEEHLPVDMIWTALDKLKESEILSKGEDAELLAMGLTARGHAYLKILKLRTRAKQCLTEALDISKTLPGNLYTNTSWYGNLTTIIQEIRDKEAAEEEAEWSNVRKVHLEALKEVLEELRSADFGSSLADLTEFLFDKCTPIHLSEASRKNIPKVDVDVGSQEGKKALIKLIAMFHTDKVNKETHGVKHYVLMEEVSKILTRRYNTIKEMD